MTTPTNRPILARDSQDNVIQDTSLDCSFRGEYSGSNLIYVGYARAGVSESVAKWQIRKLTYAGSNLVSVTWPSNDNGVATTDFQFVWADRATYTYI